MNILGHFTVGIGNSCNDFKRLITKPICHKNLKNPTWIDLLLRNHCFFLKFMDLRQVRFAFKKWQW